MPALARKILIVAAIDGLILSPIQNSRSAPKPPQSVKIDWKSKQILPHAARKEAGKAKDEAAAGAVTPNGLEAHGIAGLLNISPTSSFLVAITSREQVATIRGRHPIYVVTDVALIPLSSQHEADAYIARTRPRTAKGDTDGATSSEEEEELQDDIAEAPSSSRRSSIDAAGASTAGEDVIGRKGLYGRFAEKWFSKRGWTEDRRRSEGLSPGERPPVAPQEVDVSHAVEDREGVDITKPENRPAPNGEEEGSVVDGAVDSKGELKKKEVVEEAVEAVKEDVAHNLTPKLLNTTRLLLGGSRSFYFSYDWDITRSWSTQRHSKSESLPLWKLVDPLFFWNHHLQKPFIDANQNAFVLPLMQGFVGQLPFTTTTTAVTPPPSQDQAPTFESMVPTQQNLLLTLISRRSIRRAGLRYLRRGVDDNGNVANSVETEQLVSDSEWNRVFSYLQIRGSIPLYFQQSPYALKPKPILLRTEAANATAFSEHFKAATDRYGRVHAVSLVEKHGNEAIVGEKYRAAMQGLPEQLNRNVGFSWFDFHHECRGMRFENVSRLFDEIGPVLDGLGYHDEEAAAAPAAEGAVVHRRQAGVLRTNCMDCLDRTNVVQSAAARAALEKNLAALGVRVDGGGGGGGGEAEAAWFNRLWADNGDAISKQYASTAALKGDFTRTRKRNYRGALTDFGLTLTRYFTNIVSDFFTQAAIDFLLGSVSARVFDEFEEQLMSGDPAVSMDRLRQHAVEVSSRIVVEDEDEVLRGGWTVLAPAEAGTLRTFPFREVVVLVTDKALYRCGFDFALEKVCEFERVELADVVGVQWGTYIISTLAHPSTDEKRNVGFIVSYQPSSAGGSVVRVNTRSMKSMFSKGTSAHPKFMAFKVLPGAASNNNETQLVEGVCREIEAARNERLMKEGVPGAAEEQQQDGGFVVRKDVIGLAEAKRSTGLLEQWGYSLRKSVWA
ncbi:SacI homology domain-containing protein [Morchella snyderi]|nr:SacI homology domain-containing protein [Morchella snyderi]